jgi:hypothetical protein
VQQLHRVQLEQGRKLQSLREEVYCCLYALLKPKKYGAMFECRVVLYTHLSSSAFIHTNGDERRDDTSHSTSHATVSVMSAESEKEQAQLSSRKKVSTLHTALSALRNSVKGKERCSSVCQIDFSAN